MSDRIARRPQPLPVPWGHLQSYGGRPDHRVGALGDRHPGRADHPVHDAGPPASRGGIRSRPAHQEWAPACRLRGCHDEERTHLDDVFDARAAPQITDVGSRQGTLQARPIHDRDRRRCLLRRSAKSLAERYKRKHQWPAASVLPEGDDLARWSTGDLEAVANVLNSRPRKTLGWKTPAEALNEHLLLLQQAGVASTG